MNKFKKIILKICFQSPTEAPCTCEECSPLTDTNKPSTSKNADTTSNIQEPVLIHIQPSKESGHKKTVDVIVHDAPPDPPRFFETITTPPFHITSPPPPGFVIAPYQPPRFHTGGNVEDLLGDVQTSPTMQTTFIQQNSVFMCNTRRITQQRQPCCCQKREAKPSDVENVPPKSYVTEKNIELTYDYPRPNPVPKNSPTSPTSQSSDEIQTTTTEVASTVVFVERRIPVRPKKFDFFFRSRSAPVGDNEEPIYATVNKLPKRLRRMELANLEKEVAYRSCEPDSSTRTEITLKTDSEHSQIAPLDDDTSSPEKEKPVIPQRPDTPKAKKRRRFSFTFKKRERKRREKKKEAKNGCAKNGGTVTVESDNERLLEITEVQELGVKSRPCNRHNKPRNTMSSCSSGPRYKRDSYQVKYSKNYHIS